MNEVCQKNSIHLLHIAHKPIVHLLHGTLHGTDYVHIGSRQAQCIDTARLQAGDDILIHQPAIHHCHHFQRFGIGDAAAIYHFAFNTQLRGELRGRASASVYQDLAAFDGCKVIQQLIEGGFLFYNLATHFDYSQFLHFIPNKYIRTVRNGN